MLTQRDAAPMPDGGELIRVATVSGDGRTIDPKRLGDLRAAAGAFLEAAGGGLVVLDCLDYLVLHNGPERVARVLADVHDDVIVHGGNLVVFVKSKTSNPRLVAWLSRELDPLPLAIPPALRTEGGLAT